MCMVPCSLEPTLLLQLTMALSDLVVQYMRGAGPDVETFAVYSNINGVIFWLYLPKYFIHFRPSGIPFRSRSHSCNFRQYTAHLESTHTT